jgi:hypothetical protein
VRFRRPRPAFRPEPPLEAAGHIVCEGITFPVERVELRHGQIEITATRWGPVRPVDGGPVTIFGSDGQGICQGGTMSWREAHAGEKLVMVVRLSMDKIYEPAGG